MNWKKKKIFSLFSIQEHFAHSSPSMVVRVKFVIGMGCRNSSDASEETRMTALVYIWRSTVPAWVWPQLQQPRNLPTSYFLFLFFFARDEL